MRYRIVVVAGVGYFWWQLKSEGNGAVLATSETYTTRRKAFATADALAKALDIDVEDRSR